MAWPTNQIPCLLSFSNPLSYSCFNQPYGQTIQKAIAIQWLIIKQMSMPKEGMMTSSEQAKRSDDDIQMMSQYS